MTSLGLASTFDFSFVDAVDGRQGKVDIPGWVSDLEPHDIANPEQIKHPSLNGRWEWGQVKPVEQACLLSHMSVWREIAKSDGVGGVILEDDIMLNGKPQMGKIGHRLKEGLSKYDLVYLGYSSNLKPARLYLSFTRLRELLAKLILPSVDRDFAFHRRYQSGVGMQLDDSKVFRRAGMHFGTYAYAVSPKGARDLLRICSRVDIAADRALQCYVMLGSRAAVFDVPPFVTNDVFGSDIQDEAKFKRDALNNPQKRVES